MQPPVPAGVVLHHPIKSQAFRELKAAGLVSWRDIAPTAEPEMFEMTAEHWFKLEMHQRPCTWCGDLMGDEVDPCTKDLCVSCAHPDGDGC